VAKAEANIKKLMNGSAVPSGIDEEKPFEPEPTPETPVTLSSEVPAERVDDELEEVQKEQQQVEVAAEA